MEWNKMLLKTDFRELIKIYVFAINYVRMCFYSIDKHDFSTISIK